MTAPTAPPDGAPQVGPDRTGPGSGAGTGTGIDTGSDAGSDTGIDTGTDAGIDAGIDAGVDLAEASDDALVRSARLGDEDAFRAIVDRHGPGMYRYAVRMVGSQADAAEVTQEALVSAWRGLGSFEGRSSLRTWLIRLVHRRAVDLSRHRRPTPIDDGLLSAVVRPAHDNPLQDVLDAELLEALQLALDELPWHQRAVWLLREVEGMSYDEIATALSLPVGSVRGHLQRGRRNLAERMARWR